MSAYLPTMRGECECIQVPEEIERGVTGVGGLEAILEAIPCDERLESFSTVASAMSETSRLKIMISLSRTDLCPCLLKIITGLGDSKLSYHLNVLLRAGLIDSKKVGNWKIFSLTPLGSKSVEKVMGLMQ